MEIEVNEVVFFKEEKNSLKEKIVDLIKEMKIIQIDIKEEAEIIITYKINKIEEIQEEVMVLVEVIKKEVVEDDIMC